MDRYPRCADRDRVDDDLALTSEVLIFCARILNTKGFLRDLCGLRVYRLSHNLLNFFVKITSENLNFGLVNYAILCSSFSAFPSYSG